MFESITKFFKKFTKQKEADSKDTAKERLHLVLMQDRANVSADFLELMRQEIIEVIKKYVDADESAIDVKLINKTNSDGTIGAPALYANIPIVSIKDESRKMTLPKQENKGKEEKAEQEQTPKEEIQEEVKKAEKVIEKAEQLEQTEKEENEQKNEQKESKESNTENKEDSKIQKDQELEAKNSEKAEI